LDRVPSIGKNDWNRAGQSLGSEWRSRAASGDDGHPTAYQVGRQFRQTAEVVLRPAKFDCHVAALDVTHFAQAFAECRQRIKALRRRTKVEITDHRHCRLLRAGGERPRGCTAEPRDELPPPHSITREREQRRRHLHAELLGGLQIDDEL
jgi:hypothetical protein